MKTIETERLSLRPIQKEDASAVFTYRSDAETNKYQGWIPTRLEDVDAFIQKNPESFNLPESWFQLVIIDKESNEIVGDVGVHFFGDENAQTELGLTLNKEHHNKGYATEALRAVIDYLFTELNKHRITASIDPLNTSSIRLMERIGFRKEAHFQKSLCIDGVWVDDIIYAVLAEEWTTK